MHGSHTTYPVSSLASRHEKRDKKHRRLLAEEAEVNTFAPEREPSIYDCLGDDTALSNDAEHESPTQENADLLSDKEIENLHWRMYRQYEQQLERMTADEIEATAWWHDRRDEQ